MKQRCNNPNLPSAPWYYDKGIKVCDEWIIYSNFEKWALSNGYSDNLTIDRINSDGNYEPNNCQWITRADNARKSHIERKRHLERRNTFGRFMVVRIKKRKQFCNPFVKVIKTGLTKHDAIVLSDNLKELEKDNDCFEYHVRVTDKHKEGDFALWSDLRQYASKNKIAI